MRIKYVAGLLLIFYIVTNLFTQNEEKLSDGVIVVQRDKAVAVADAAREELNIDKEARRKLYEKIGIPIDFTVE